MNDYFVQCPHCKRAVSHRDLNNSTFGEGNWTIVDAFMPLECIHCDKRAYPPEWKKVDKPEPTKFIDSDDLFKI
jgi:ribosomal protein L33